MLGHRKDRKGRDEPALGIAGSRTQIPGRSSPPHRPPISGLLSVWLTQKEQSKKRAPGRSGPIPLALYQRRKSRSFWSHSKEVKQKTEEDLIDSPFWAEWVGVLLLVAHLKPNSWNKEKYPPPKKGNGGLGRQSKVNSISHGITFLE